MADHYEEQFKDIVPQDDVDNILQHSITSIDTLLNQQEVKLKSVIETMQLKKYVAKNFTEFLLYIIKLFLNAINDKTITLKNSLRQSFMRELNHISLVLLFVRKDFCSNDDETPPDDSVAIVVSSATKVKHVISNLHKTQWLRWLQSAKNIKTLVPVFERITKVVEGIQGIEHRAIYEILGDVEDLKISLIDIEKRLLVTQGVGLSACVVIGICSFVCMIVGGILLFTPAAPAGATFITVGGAGVSIASAAGSLTKMSYILAEKLFGCAKEKGALKGDKFVRKNITKLS